MKEAIFLVVKSNDFYIFDEATSNIDKDSEEIILEIIKKLALNNIVLNITHRLKNVLASNYIYFLKNSKIVEEGSPKKLLNENSEFKELYLYQSSLEEIKK